MIYLEITLVSIATFLGVFAIYCLTKDDIERAVLLNIGIAIIGVIAAIISILT